MATALLSLCCLWSVVVATAPCEGPGSPCEGPGQGPWQVDAPEDHFVDSNGLKVASDYLFAEGIQRGLRECFLVIKDGSLIFEQYDTHHYNVTPSAGYSMTKTLGVLIIGHAVSYLGLDIDADITAVYGVKSPKKYAVTTRQIMSQALAGNDGPGEAWAYDALGTKWIDTLPKIVSAATGKKPSQIWQLFQDQLGFDTFSFDADSSWATGAKGTCRDWARLGQLLLNEGRWPGVDPPLLSADFVEQMRTPQTRYAPYTDYANPCYGLLTWISSVDKENGTAYPGTCLHPGGDKAHMPEGSPADTFYLDGFLGQNLLVIPSHGAVVVTMGVIPDDPNTPERTYLALCKGKVFEDCDSKDDICPVSKPCHQAMNDVCTEDGGYLCETCLALHQPHLLSKGCPVAKTLSTVSCYCHGACGVSSRCLDMMKKVCKPHTGPLCNLCLTANIADLMLIGGCGPLTSLAHQACFCSGGAEAVV